MLIGSISIITKQAMKGAFQTEKQKLTVVTDHQTTLLMHLNVRTTTIQLYISTEQDAAIQVMILTLSPKQEGKGLDFLGGSSGRKSACIAGDVVSITELGISPGGGHGTHPSILAWKMP